MRNRVGSQTTRRPHSPSGAIERRSKFRQFQSMNGRAADVVLATPPDLHEPPEKREFPIGAWATPDNPAAAKCPTITKIFGDHQTALNPSPRNPIRPSRMRLARTSRPTQYRRPEKSNKQLSRRPRRFPLDISLLIGGTRSRACVLFWVACPRPPRNVLCLQ
jgi:hypothetical protein